MNPLQLRHLRLVLLFGVLLFTQGLTVSMSAQTTLQLGIHYQYGAAFNLHPTNSKKWFPTDVSVPALFFHLKNNKNQLGLRAALGWRKEEIRFHLMDRFYLHQSNQAIDCKIQCTLPLSARGTIALGFAPRWIYRSHYFTEYKNELNNTFYGDTPFDLYGYKGNNPFNASIALSYYYQITKRWLLSIHLDHDVLNAHQNDLDTSFLYDTPNRNLARSVNGRLTAVSLALGFNLWSSQPY